MQMLKYLSIAWLSACVRNEKDRAMTMKAINNIGNEIDKTIKSFQKKPQAQAVNEEVQKTEVL